jgi:hypothetical protein
MFGVRVKSGILNLWKNTGAQQPWRSGQRPVRAPFRATILTLFTLYAGALGATLSDRDLQRIAEFEHSPRLLDMPVAMRADMAPEVEAAYQDARASFSGRGSELARHFLTNTGFPPGNSAWNFMLEAVGDSEAAIELIHALWEPPAVQSGPPISAGGRTWLRERDTAEVHWAIASILVNEAVNTDPRVLTALLEAFEKLRPDQDHLGPGDASRVVELMAQLRGPEARAALQELARDRDAAIRALAIQGLGQAAGGELEQSAATQAAVVRALHSDPDPQARIEAAAALGRIGSADAIDPLRAALAREAHPQVVDAIVLALEELNVPWTEPQTCGDVVARTWEPRAAQRPFACWRAGVSAEGLREAAVGGPGQLRALALHALVEPALAYRPGVDLARLAPAVVPPPSPAQADQQTVTLKPAERTPPGPPQIAFEAPWRERLLESLTDLLSRPSGVTAAGAEISASTVTLLHDALWEIAGHDMPTALQFADRIAAPDARYVTQGRFGASWALWRKDPDSYEAYRRPRLAGTAALLAAACAVLLAWRRTRRAGFVLVLAALTWAAWTLAAVGPRELPPPPFAFMTVYAIALAAAGLCIAALALFEKPAARIPPGKAFTRGLLGIGLAAVLAFFVCGYTRWNGIFPIGGEGWELIFDPLGSAIIAAVAAAGLALVDGVVIARSTGRTRAAQSGS